MSALIEALDTVFLRERYLPTVIPPDEWDSDDRSFEQQLHSQRLAREGAPTWGALIAFASDPLAFVPGAGLEFLRLQGNEVTTPTLSKHTLAGRLDEVARRLDELIRLHVATRVRVAGTLTEQRSPDYPADALRQLAHNAIMHRSYEGTHTPVRIYWYADRVQIVSPGGLFSCEGSPRAPRLRALRTHEPRELPARRHGLPQPAARGSHGQPRHRATVRVGPSLGKEGPVRQRQPAAMRPVERTSALTQRTRVRGVAVQAPERNT